jgi:hypothetical protein
VVRWLPPVWRRKPRRGRELQRRRERGRERERRNKRKLDKHEKVGVKGERERGREI